MGAAGRQGPGAVPSCPKALLALLAAAAWSLRPAAAATPCARALYAPAVARPGSSFWVVAQFDGGGPNLSAACGGGGAAGAGAPGGGDCGLFAQGALPAVVPGSLQAYPSLVRAAIVRVALEMPAAARLVTATLALAPCEPSPPVPPLSVSVAAAGGALLPPRPPQLSVSRAPSLVDATFDVRLEFSDRVSWLDPSAVLVNTTAQLRAASGGGGGGATAAATQLGPPGTPSASNSGNSTNNNSTASSTANATTTNNATSASAPPKAPSLPSKMAAAAGPRVAMASRPSSSSSGDPDAAAGTALVLTVDGAAPGQTVLVQVPARALTGAGQTAPALDSSVLAVRVPAPGALLPGVGVLAGKLLPSALGVSAGVCLAAALLAPGTQVAAVACSSGALLRSAGHAQVAAALGAALSSPLFGLAPSVAMAAGQLRWSMLQWLPPAFNGPLATYFAAAALRFEETRAEARDAKRAAVLGPQAAAAFARQSRAQRESATLAAVVQSGLWRQTIGSALIRGLSTPDGRVRDFWDDGEAGGGRDAGSTAAAAPPPLALLAPANSNALADRDVALTLDGWLRDMQLGEDAALPPSSALVNGTSGSRSGCGVLSYALAAGGAAAATNQSAAAPINATLQQQQLAALRATYVAPRALLSRQALPAAAWVLVSEADDGPSGRPRREAALAAAWVALLGAAEVAVVAMFAALLLHAAAAAVEPAAGSPPAAGADALPPALPQQQQQQRPSLPPPAILPLPPRILPSLPVPGWTDGRGENLARRAIQNNALVTRGGAARRRYLEEEEREGEERATASPLRAAAAAAAAASEAVVAPISPPLFVWPKLAVITGMAVWPPLLHLACGLLPNGAPAWMAAAIAAPIAALGVAGAAWVFWWAVRRGPAVLLRPACLLDAQATSRMVAGDTGAEKDAARCRELVAEDREDRMQQEEEEEEEQRQRRRREEQQQQRPRPASSLRPPEPSASPPFCTITEIHNHNSGPVVGFAERATNGRRLRASLRADLVPFDGARRARSPSPSPPPTSSPSPAPAAAERLLHLVPPIYYVPMTSPSGNSASMRSSPSPSMAMVTLLRPVLLPPPAAGAAAVAAAAAAAAAARTPSPLPSRSPALLAPSRGQRATRARNDYNRHDEDDDEDDDEDKDDLDEVRLASASAQFLQTTGMAVSLAPPAPLPLLLRAAGQGGQGGQMAQVGNARANAAAANALLQARLTAYAGAAGTLLADILAAVVVVPSAAAEAAEAADALAAAEGQAAADEANERALQSRAVPALLGANALAFAGTLLICALAGLLGATSAPAPLDAAARAATAVVPFSWPAADSPRAVAAVAYALVWTLLPLRIVWAGLATQAYASASAALFEAACTACEVGLLVVAAVALPVLRDGTGGGGGGPPQALSALSVAALILLLCEMIVLTVGEIVRTFIVLFAAGGLGCWPAAGRGAAAAASGRVAPG